MEAVADGLFFFGFLIGVAIEPGFLGFGIDFAINLKKSVKVCREPFVPSKVSPAHGAYFAQGERSFGRLN